jgi:hypothetical protein
MKLLPVCVAAVAAISWLAVSGAGSSAPTAAGDAPAQPAARAADARFDGLVLPGFVPADDPGAATTRSEPGFTAASRRFTSAAAPGEIVEEYRRAFPKASVIRASGVTMVSARLFGGPCMAVTIEPVPAGGSRVAVAVTERWCDRAPPSDA